MYERLKLEEIADGKRPFPTSEKEFAVMLEAVDDDELYQKVLVAALVQSNQIALDTLKEGGIVPTPMVIARAKIAREERKHQSETDQRKTMEANRRPAGTPPTRPATMEKPPKENGFELYPKSQFEVYSIVAGGLIFVEFLFTASFVVWLNGESGISPVGFCCVSSIFGAILLLVTVYVFLKSSYNREVLLYKILRELKKCGCDDPRTKE